LQDNPTPFYQYDANHVMKSAAKANIGSDKRFKGKSSLEKYKNEV
jgi:hypothetical protein